MKRSWLLKKLKLRLIERLKRLLKKKWTESKRLRIERDRLLPRLKTLKCWLLRNQLIPKRWLLKLNK